MNSRYCQSGMTLLEILVALTIFVLMAGAGYSGLQQALQIQEGLQQEQQYWRRLDTVMTLLQQDLGQARDLLQRIPVNSTQSFAGSSEPDLSRQGEMVLFSRGGHVSYADGPVSPHIRVAYRLRDRTLYRTIWPRLNMPEDQQGLESELIDGIANIELRYLDTTRQWVTMWPSLPGRDTPSTLPRAVRFSIELVDGQVYERVFHVGPAG